MRTRAIGLVCGVLALLAVLSPGVDARRIRGSTGDDLLFGSNKDDRIFGNTGADILFGKGNADRVDGGSPASRFSFDVWAAAFGAL